MMVIESPNCSSNLPNLRKLRLINVDDVIKIIDPFNDDWTVPVGGIFLKEHSTIIAVKFGYRMATFSEDLQRQVNGISYLQKVDAVIPRDCPQIITGMNYLQNRKFIGLIKDGNGRIKIVGTKNQPLRVTGNSLSIGINSRSIILSTEVKQPGYFFGSIEDDVLLSNYFNQSLTISFI